MRLLLGLFNSVFLSRRKQSVGVSETRLGRDAAKDARFSICIWQVKSNGKLKVKNIKGHHLSKNRPARKDFQGICRLLILTRDRSSTELSLFVLLKLGAKGLLSPLFLLAGEFPFGRYRHCPIHRRSSGTRRKLN